MAIGFRSRRSSRRRPNEEAPSVRRTVSIWPFLAAFLLLGVVGLIGVLLGYSTQRSNSEQIVVPQTTVGTMPAEAPGASIPVTVPGGAPAPDGVSGVLRENSVTTYTFAVPESVSAAASDTAIFPTTAVPTADGTGLTLSVGCAASAEEALVQISVTEDPTAVTVLVVGLVPRAGVPCQPETPPEVISVPLESPIGSRPVVVVSPGTPIPGLDGS